MLKGFKGRNHAQQIALRGADDGVDTRETLPEIFDPINARHHFTLDAAANDFNTKAAKYFTLATDGLKQSWRGERVWVNPPFSNLGGWVRKALEEVNGGGMSARGHALAQ